MSSLRVLIRSFVRVFYETNIGFFLIVMYLAFGVMGGNEHIALATSIATSLPLTLLTLLLWSVYFLKVFGFIYKTINQNEYKFIRQISLHSINTQFIWLFSLVFLMGMPAWAYAFFIANFNFSHHTYWLFILMIGFLIVINTLIVVVTIQRLKQPMRESKVGLWHTYISKKIRLPYSLWYIRHLFVHEPLLAFFTKASSLFVLSISFYLFETDMYDWRLLAIGALFAFITNSMLIYNYYEFNSKNYWIFNLPRTQTSIISNSLLTTSFLFVPEVIIFLVQMPSIITLPNQSGLLLMEICLAYFLLSTLLIKPIIKDLYGKRVFFLFVAMVLIIMYSTPLYIINLILITLGIWITSNFYKLIISQ